MSDGTDRGSIGDEAPKAAYLAGLADYEGPLQKRRGRPKVSRRRIVEAATRLFARKGFYGLKVGEIPPESGFSRQTFYTEFETREHCFEAALGAASEQLRERVGEAIATGVDRRERLDLAVAALLDFAVEDSDGAKLILVEAPVAAAAGMDDCRGEFSRFWKWLAGELGFGWLEERSTVVAMACVGGIEAVLSARLRGEEPAVKVALGPLIVDLAMRAFTAEQEDREGVKGGSGNVVFG